MRKIGIDIHGVIDKNPKIFSKLTQWLKSNGYEIHILTGAKITEELITQLITFNIQYNRLFSILDYHEKNGKTDMWQDDKGNWWIDDDIWNKTKSMYAEGESLDLHIDDTRKYGEYFNTPFIHYTIDSNIEVDSKLIKDEFISEIIGEMKIIDNNLKIIII